MHQPVLVTPPAAPPVTLDEAKSQLDITYTDKDALITGLINAAVSHLDGWTGILGRALLPQTWRQDFDAFERSLRLLLFPVRSITSVKYDDAGNVEQTVAPANYDLREDELGPYVQFKDGFSFPDIRQDKPAVRVTYIAGYADAHAVPAAIKQAMLLLIRHWFDNPTAVQVGNIVNVMPMAVDALLWTYRRTRF
jgi:uncharacterized phiE125 gp8 family phage protein